MPARRRTKENTLSATWSTKQRDIVYSYPTSRIDARLLHYVFDTKRRREDGTYEDPVWKQLEDRGYDLTTVRFSIMKKEVTNATPLEAVSAVLDKP